MSIINEAIKKARKDFEVKGVNEKNKTALVTSSASETKWMAVLLISIVLVVSLLGTIVIYKQYAKNLYSKNTPKITRQEHHKKAALAKHAIKDPMEKLNGIVYGSNDKWVIINDKILREGDSLSTGKVTLIAENFVKIRNNNGEELVLNLR